MKTVIITGASGGIGSETARIFAENGYAVVICYNTNFAAATLLEKELKDNGYSALAFKSDMSSSESISALFAATDKEFGEISALVCNAGISKSNIINNVSEEELYDVMNINFGGVFRCCREAVPYFLKNHSGNIVNISSIWGITGASCESLYSSSKAAVIGLTKSLAKELAPSGIRVNCVAPGVIDTEMNACYSEDEMNELISDTPLGRIGTPRDVAEAIYFLCSERSSFITGQTLTVDGGFIL